MDETVAFPYHLFLVDLDFALLGLGRRKMATCLRMSVKAQEKNLIAAYYPAAFTELPLLVSQESDLRSF